eukprot:CAMPEP_0177586990 /NCGR_PEP_ID=MMETSP0419_2-20121207/5387_1 /TAXON_ID=582737 /ORGANISM="Tetraselmis sp., Strain GSL018" /LENGTH=119 /DNA_ID=CAMNT_0019076959 /DNA_START=195 /DNA_END=554 /DNA_ORIENTATION=+
MGGEGAGQKVCVSWMGRDGGSGAALLPAAARRLLRRGSLELEGAAAGRAAARELVLPPEDVGRDRQEGLIYVDVVLRAGLEEWDAELYCQLLACCVGDLPQALIIHIALVANKYLVDGV